MDGWAKIKKAAEYADTSERTLRDWIKAGLKHSRLPSGTVLIKYEWIDQYLESFTEQENHVDAVVDDVMGALK